MSGDEKEKVSVVLRCQHTPTVDPPFGSDRKPFEAYMIVEGEGRFTGVGLCEACSVAVVEMLKGEPFKARVHARL